MNPYNALQLTDKLGKVIMYRHFAADAVDTP